MSIESGNFDWWPGKGEESGPDEGEQREVDLRPESEVFSDHERLENAEAERQLALARDSLAEDVDGVLHIDIADYRFSSDTNPFVGLLPRTTKIFQIARIIDVVLLHRFMFHDILVVGLRSMDFADTHSRAGFIKRVRESGGAIVLPDEDSDYDFEALRFVPYTASYSVGSWLERYHKQPPYRDERPHHPVDVWLIYDEHAYDRVDGDDTHGHYRLKPGCDRKSTLLTVAQIN